VDEETGKMQPGDLVIASEGGDYVVTREPEGTIGRATSEQEAVVLACAERRGHRVWCIERDTGTLVPVKCSPE
jgi:hypothetical protein